MTFFFFGGGQKILWPILHILGGQGSLNLHDRRPWWLQLRRERHSTAGRLSCMMMRRPFNGRIFVVRKSHGGRVAVASRRSCNYCLRRRFVSHVGEKKSSIYLLLNFSDVICYYLRCLSFLHRSRIFHPYRVICAFFTNYSALFYRTEIVENCGTEKNKN